MAITGGRGLTMCAVVFLFIGCAVDERLSTSKEKFYAVKVDKAAFFKFGPQQGNGADKELPKGTIMALIRPSFGYCKVHLTSGENGYVASEDISVASPALMAAASAPPVPAPETNTRRQEHFDLNSNDPRLDVPPEELPESPEPTPIPGTSP